MHSDEPDRKLLFNDTGNVTDQDINDCLTYKVSLNYATPEIMFYCKKLNNLLLKLSKLYN